MDALHPHPHGTAHVERHFTGSEVVRDIAIGMADGLTVPFALAAGLSAIASPGIIVAAGLAEIAAGSIAMGLGGYLAARGDIEHYESERAREQREVHEKPEVEADEVREILERYGLAREQADSIVTALRARPEAWIDFMMRFELGLEEPDPQRAKKSAATIAAAYVGGGLIPLFPYMIFGAPRTALGVSVAVTSFALVLFGLVKGRFMGTPPLRSALHTLFVGGLAALAAFLLARTLA
jgi:VIT1/CCC1 family predicted Fe2+/Mn2+ transporter